MYDPVVRTRTQQRRSNLPWAVALGLLLALFLAGGFGYLIAQGRGGVEAAGSATPTPDNRAELPLVKMATPVPTEAPSAAWIYPLKGLVYQACVWTAPGVCTGWNTTGDAADVYNPIWTVDGRLWQPHLPTAVERESHEVSVQIWAGNYHFNGVVCELRNAQGKVVVGNGNALSFQVTGTEKADFKVSCQGGVPSGFEILFTGDPTHLPVATPTH